MLWILQRGQVFVLSRVPSVAFGSGRSRRGDEHLELSSRAICRRVIVGPPQIAFFLFKAHQLIRSIVNWRVREELWRFIKCIIESVRWRLSGSFVFEQEFKWRAHNILYLFGLRIGL